MTRTEFINKVHELTDILKSDNAGYILLDNLERTRIENELAKLQHEYFINNNKKD